MKKAFELDTQFFIDRGFTIDIVGEARKKESTYVSINKPNGDTLGWIKDKDLELFAVNILKALNSKRVLQGKVPYYKLKK